MRATTRSQILATANDSPQKIWGILTRKERWGLSARGWLLLGCLAVILFFGFILNIHPFLAETYRVDAKTLVVEGWVYEHGIRTAIEEFKTGRYDHVFTTGGPPVRAGANSSDQTAANVIADWLQYRGIPSEVLQAVPSHEIERDRTYYSALALRTWLREHHMTVNSLNVVTETTHARRTRLLYQKAFGNGVTIGIIAAPNPDYDPKRWWRYSDGVRDVVSETCAYIYAKLFFHPEQSHSGETAQVSKNAGRLFSLLRPNPDGLVTL